MTMRVQNQPQLRPTPSTTAAEPAGSPAQTPPASTAGAQSSSGSGASQADTYREAVRHRGIFGAVNAAGGVPQNPFRTSGH
jgi:hypothetical protein